MMEYISQISLMTADGMYSKVFAAWLFMLYAQLAGHCVHFLNVHCKDVKCDGEQGPTLKDPIFVPVF
jgi:hypothetical protein